MTPFAEARLARLHQAQQPPKPPPAPLPLDELARVCGLKFIDGKIVP